MRSPMTVEPPKQTQRDAYASLRAVLHSVGLRECASRDFFAKGTGSIGIHHWTYMALKEIERLKRAGHWEGKVPNEPTARRRANYMASEEWTDYGIPRETDEPPLWTCVGPIEDVNPYKGVDVWEYQSGYRPLEGGST